MHYLITDQILGQMVAHMHMIEFQKWGLPDAHVLIILANEDRTITDELVDSIVVAELPPDPEATQNEEMGMQCQRLQELMLTNMINGLCGTANP